MNYKQELLNETVELADLDLRIDVLQKEILDYIRSLEEKEQNEDDVLNLSKMYHDLYKLQEDKKKLIPKVYVGYKYLEDNKDEDENVICAYCDFNGKNKDLIDVIMCEEYEGSKIDRYTESDFYYSHNSLKDVFKYKIVRGCPNCVDDAGIVEV